MLFMHCSVNFFNNFYFPEIGASLFQLLFVNFHYSKLYSPLIPLKSIKAVSFGFPVAKNEL